MPTISVNKRSVLDGIGAVLTDEQFGDLCFDYGLELDDIIDEEITDEMGSPTGQMQTVYRVEIPANRYDLLCLEGLVLALNVFLRKRACPNFTKVLPINISHQTMIVKKSVLEVRPYVVCATLRGITFTPETYRNFIDLQDKLHQNICRKRTLASVGTHDLDTIKGPFYYEARKPTDIRFAPLNQTQEYTAEELMSLYSTNSHLKPYLPIIRDKPVYPVIYDSNGVVLSLPPIINSNHSKLTLKTRNVFIEVTATDLQKANIVLDTLLTMFSGYCDKPNETECVNVVPESGEDGSSAQPTTYPQLEYRVERVKVDDIDRVIGIKTDAAQAADLLTRMCLQTTSCDDGWLQVIVPPTRHDVLHACDIYEDVAISFGYNNIEMIFPQTFTVAHQFALNSLTDQLRHELARHGLTEALTFALCSRDDVGEKLRLDVNQLPAVHIGNPKSQEFQVVRTSLLPGLLKTLSSNKGAPLPIRLFEVSDVVMRCSESEVGAKNERRLCVVHYAKTSGFEFVQGLLDRVMLALQVPFVGSSSPANASGYRLSKAECATYFPERCAHVLYKGQPIGTIGVLHPLVLANFELPLPVSAFEINIEPFLI